MTSRSAASAFLPSYLLMILLAGACATSPAAKAREAADDAADVADDARREAKRHAARDFLLKGDEPIMCTSGADCEFKWARATQWLQDNSTWKFRNITDTIMTTEGPLDTNRPAFDVTKFPTGDGKTYRINLRAGCGGTHDCSKDIQLLRVSFTDFVKTPPPSH